MDLSGKHIAILVDNYFEQAEFEEPLSYLRDAGAEVTIIALKARDLQGLNHVDKGDKFQADLLLAEASSVDYDALVLPGGAINADGLRINEDAQEWARDFLESGRPLAAICHAPWLLVSADLIEGRRLTSYYTIADDIRNAGGDWVDEEVVVDNNLITSRKPDDIPAFNNALERLLKQRIAVASASAADLPAISDRVMEDELRLRSLGYSDEDIDIDADKLDILADELDETPDEFNPSDVVSDDERDGDD